MNVTGIVSGNLNGVQGIMDIFTGSCDTNSSDEGIKQHCTSIGAELKIVEHLTTKCEWFKDIIESE